MKSAGRPRNFDEAKVLAAATRVFWEHGYDQASLTQLREATGLSSASLYGAFGSKLGLFERAVEFYRQGPGSVTDFTGVVSLPAPDALTAVLHDSIEMQSDPAHPLGCLIALSATTWGDSDDAKGARAVIVERRDADRAAIRETIRRGQSEGTLRTGDAEDFVAVVHGFLLGISTLIRDGMAKDHLHAAADALVNGLLREN